MDTQEFGVRNTKPEKPDSLGMTEAEHEAMQAEASDPILEMGDKSMTQATAFAEAEKSAIAAREALKTGLDKHSKEQAPGSEAWNTAITGLGAFHRKNLAKAKECLDKLQAEEDTELKLEKLNIASDIRADMELYADEPVDPDEIKKMVDKQFLEKHPELKTKKSEPAAYGSVCFGLDDGWK